DTGDAFRRVGTGRRRRRAIALALLAVVVVVIGAYGVRVWRYWDRHISTDDAFVEAHISPVSARVRGTVVEVLARDNEEVPAGARRTSIERASIADGCRSCSAASWFLVRSSTTPTARSGWPARPSKRPGDASTGRAPRWRRPKPSWPVRRWRWRKRAGSARRPRRGSGTPGAAGVRW